MKTKTILFTSVHPASYIDRWITELKSNFKIITLYSRKRDMYKKYDGNNSNCICINELSLLELIRLILRSELVFVGGWAFSGCLRIIFLTKILNRPCSVFSDYPILKSKKKGLKYLFKKLVIFNIVDFIYCATYSTSDYFANTYNLSKSKLKVLPYYCNSNISSFESEDINKSILNIFIANNFIQRKGYDILLKSFQELELGGYLNRYSVTIAGQGELFDYYLNKFNELSPKIKFIGWIDNEQYNNYMSACDIFIHASHFEPFGIPPLDAMKKKKVVIASTGVKSAEEIIIHGKDGFLFNPNYPSELTSILKSLSIDSIQDIGINAESTVTKFYNNNSITSVINSSIND